MDTKICTECGRELPATIDYFNRKGIFNNSLRPKCKQCEKNYRDSNKEHKREVDRNYRQVNSDRIHAQKSEYYQSHKDQELDRYYKWRDGNIDHHRQYHKDYAVQHKEHKSDYDKEYREKNRDNIIKRQHRWNRENIEHVRSTKRVAASRRQARENNASGNHTAEDISQIYKAQKGRCYYCGCKVGKKYHIDHVIPLSRGGSNSPDNLVISCPHCNVSKNDKLPHEWNKGGRLL